MDLDSFITFLLFIAVFVLPSILKQVRAIKNKQPKTQKQETVFSKVRQYFLQLEKQARMARPPQQKSDRPSDNIWEILRESNADQGQLQEETFAVPDPLVEIKKEKVTQVPKSPPGPVPRKQAKLIEMPRQEDFKIPARFKKDTLQNAIVWSEILSKPVSLR